MGASWGTIGGCHSFAEVSGRKRALLPRGRGPMTPYASSALGLPNPRTQVALPCHVAYIGGWPEPPALASKLLTRMTAARRTIADTRGLLVVRVGVPAGPLDAEFKWLRAPPEVIPDDAVWYFDGSMIGGRWVPLRRTGFGIAIVASDGSLLAFGNGNPPSWVTNAAGAEAWALLVVSEVCPCLPHVVTDCKGVRDMLCAGRVSATAHTRPLARIWKGIFHALDNVDDPDRYGSRLVWMPAHGAIHTIGNVTKSNGAAITSIDWRATRLVDALAKLAAACHQVPRLLEAGAKAVEHCAGLVGVTAFAANHYNKEVVRPDGSIGKLTCRDAAPQNGCKVKRKGRSRTVTLAMPATEAVTNGGSSLRMQSLSKETQSDVSFHTWWRESLGNRLSASSIDAPPAQERLEALRRRVAAKEARARCQSPPSLDAEFRGAKRRALAWPVTAQVTGPACLASSWSAAGPIDGGASALDRRSRRPDRPALPASSSSECSDAGDGACRASRRVPCLSARLTMGRNSGRCGD